MNLVPAPLLVLTATLGRSPWLDETVASVAGQVGEFATHLLIAPEAQLEELRLRYPRCAVIAERPEGGGLYGALNAGLAAAQGSPWQWMTFIADDDLLLPGFRSLYLTAASRTAPGARAIWHGEVAMIDAAGRQLCRVPYTRRAADVPALVAAGYSPFNQQGMLYSRAAVDRTGPFVTALRVCADAEHWLRALERGATLQHQHVLAAAFRVRPGQLSGAVETHRAEFGSLRERARRLQGAQAGWPAVLRFRVANLPLYLERLRRVGFASGFDLLRPS